MENDIVNNALRDLNELMKRPQGYTTSDLELMSNVVYEHQALFLAD